MRLLFLFIFFTSFSFGSIEDQNKTFQIEIDNYIENKQYKKVQDTYNSYIQNLFKTIRNKPHLYEKYRSHIKKTVQNLRWLYNDNDISKKLAKKNNFYTLINKVYQNYLEILNNLNEQFSAKYIDDFANMSYLYGKFLLKQNIQVDKVKQLYLDATVIYLKSAIKNKTTDNQIKLALALKTLASLYKSNKEYSEAKKYYKQSIKIFKEFNLKNHQFLNIKFASANKELADLYALYERTLYKSKALYKKAQNIYMYEILKEIKSIKKNSKNFNTLTIERILLNLHSLYDNSYNYNMKSHLQITKNNPQFKLK